MGHGGDSFSMSASSGEAMGLSPRLSTGDEIGYSDYNLSAHEANFKRQSIRLQQDDFVALDGERENHSSAG